MYDFLSDSSEGCLGSAVIQGGLLPPPPLLPAFPRREDGRCWGSIEARGRGWRQKPVTGRGRGHSREEACRDREGKNLGRRSEKVVRVRVWGVEGSREQQRKREMRRPQGKRTRESRKESKTDRKRQTDGPEARLKEKARGDR